MNDFLLRLSPSMGYRITDSATAWARLCVGCACFCACVVRDGFNHPGQVGLGVRFCVGCVCIGRDGFHHPGWVGLCVCVIVCVDR